jgi:hypothetical protein
MSSRRAKLLSPKRTNKKKTKTVPEKAPAPTEFHPPIFAGPHALCPWQEEDTIESMNLYTKQALKHETYPKKKTRQLNVGDVIYVPYDNTGKKDNENEEGETTMGCYLGKIISIDKKTVVHFTDTTTLTGIDKKHEQTSEEVELEDYVYLALKGTEHTSEQKGKQKNNEHENLTKKLDEILENTNTIIKQTKNNSATPHYPQHPYLQAATQHPQIPPNQHTAQLTKPRPLQDPTRQLVIRNVPVTENENLDKIITNIASKKDMTLTTADYTCLRAISKSKENSEKTTPPNIIVTFHNNDNKNNFKKKPKDDITISDIVENSEDNDTKVYIQENLAPNVRELFWKTRKFKTEHSYAYAWTKNGTIYLKKNQDDERPRRIETETQVTELANSQVDVVH